MPSFSMHTTHQLVRPVQWPLLPNACMGKKSWMRLRLRSQQAIMHLLGQFFTFILTSLKNGFSPHVFGGRPFGASGPPSHPWVLVGLGLLGFLGNTGKLKFWVSLLADLRPTAACPYLPLFSHFLSTKSQLLHCLNWPTMRRRTISPDSKRYARGSHWKMAEDR